MSAQRSSISSCVIAVLICSCLAWLLLPPVRRAGQLCPLAADSAQQYDQHPSAASSFSPHCCLGQRAGFWTFNHTLWNIFPQSACSSQQLAPLYYKATIEQQVRASKGQPFDHMMHFGLQQYQSHQSDMYNSTARTLNDADIDLTFLHNRSILVYGDSVDSAAAELLCADLQGMMVYKTPYDEYNKTTWAKFSFPPRVCYVKELNFTYMMLFTYGVMHSYYPGVDVPNAPTTKHIVQHYTQEIVSRVWEYVPHLAVATFDMVMLNSCLWDVLREIPAWLEQVTDVHSSGIRTVYKQRLVEQLVEPVLELHPSTYSDVTNARSRDKLLIYRTCPNAQYADHQPHIPQVNQVAEWLVHEYPLYPIDYASILDRLEVYYTDRHHPNREMQRAYLNILFNVLRQHVTDKQLISPCIYKHS